MNFHGLGRKINEFSWFLEASEGPGVALAGYWGRLEQSWARSRTILGALGHS